MSFLITAFIVLRSRLPILVGVGSPKGDEVVRGDSFDRSFPDLVSDRLP